MIINITKIIKYIKSILQYINLNLNLLAAKKDYVIASETTNTSDGSWRYRQWKSGKVEAWASLSLSSKYNTAAGKLYASSLLTVNIPSIIFGDKTPQFLSISKPVSNNSYTVSFGGSGYIDSPTAMKVMLYRLTSTSTATSYAFDFHLIYNPDLDNLQ